ncbi:MAG: MarR family winged helix-turn-helix transcriptional regulator [Brachymonas sp.]
MAAQNTPRQKTTAASKPNGEPTAEAVRSWLSVVQAYNLCDALLGRELATIGLRNAEYEILANVLREPGLSQQVLAQRCFTAKSHISALLTSMQERGWLRRENHPQDARAKSLYLEPQGQAMAERGKLIQTEVVKIMAQAISPLQMQQIHEAMLAVNAAFEAQLR